ncbi:hypothetical protein [Neobacillus drentensis]|uniref:hypothetical protein n=1 Tax=Neobacillus drentensis TaxID=220684 RepID=UPI000BF56530|nr:hypothetical protein CN481_20420 [Bacillus sp. AFS006103]
MKRLIMILLLVGLIIGGFILNSQKGTLTLHDPKMAADIQTIARDKVSVIQTNKLGDKSASAFFSVKSEQYGEMYGFALLDKKWNGKYRIPPITEKNDWMVQWGTNDLTASVIETKDGLCEILYGKRINDLYGNVPIASVVLQAQQFSVNKQKHVTSHIKTTVSVPKNKDAFFIAKPVPKDLSLPYYKGDRANQIGLTFKLFDESGKEINVR